MTRPPVRRVSLPHPAPRSDHDSPLVLDLRLDTDALERSLDALRRARPPQDLGQRLAAGFRQAEVVMRRAAQEMARGLEAAGRTLRRWQERLVEAANRPEVIAGLEARYLVRAGLDPAYRSTDALVASIMAGQDPEGDLRLVTREHRAQIAAAALRGHVQSYPAQVPVLTWHRLLGGTAVVVTRG